jgi:hypothetical protein
MKDHNKTYKIPVRQCHSNCSCSSKNFQNGIRYQVEEKTPQISIPRLLEDFNNELKLLEAELERKEEKRLWVKAMLLSLLVGALTGLILRFI